ncbi:MAG: YceI family protein [Geodermatophilaceae bacterium]|nr:YceI family protein [Geodermatophilaceae bacterium]
MTTTTAQTTRTVLPLAQGRWALDTDHTTVGFTIRHLGVAKVRGRFGTVSAELVIGATLDDSMVTAGVDLASIDTGNETRDAHLRSAELLDVANRTTMSYRSTRIRGEGSDWTLDGELTIGDVTRPLSLATEFGGVEAFFDGTRHAGFEATGEIRRKDFGLGFGPVGAMLGDVVKVELDLQFIEPKVAAHSGDPRSRGDRR